MLDKVIARMMFNKVKKGLVKANIDLKEYIFIDFKNKTLNIDGKAYDWAKSEKYVIDGVTKAKLGDIKEILLTKDEMKLKFEDNKKESL